MPMVRVGGSAEIEEITGYSNKWYQRFSGANSYSGVGMRYTLPERARVYVQCSTSGNSISSNVTNGQIYEAGFEIQVSYSYSSDSWSHEAFYFASITAVWVSD